MASAYEELRWDYEELLGKYRRLEAENQELRSERDRLDHQVRTELEPRIKREERNYDHWALSPSRAGGEDV